jgi:hypothetical protein
MMMPTMIRRYHSSLARPAALAVDDVVDFLAEGVADVAPRPLRLPPPAALMVLMTMLVLVLVLVLHHIRCALVADADPAALPRSQR